MKENNFNRMSERKRLIQKTLADEYTKEKEKTKLQQFDDMPGFNNSFMTPENLRWFYYVVNWLPNPAKPLLFLPCGRAEKTREKYGKKVISKGMGHNFMKAVRDNNWFEKVILSEPLTIIPYALEMHELRPDYNLPKDDLSIQSERIFINQVALWLLKVKKSQPHRHRIYYLGGAHHYFIIHFANILAGNPFELIYEVPETGRTGLTRGAKLMEKIIYESEINGFTPYQREISLEDHLKSRGRYTCRKFWKSIIIYQRKKGITQKDLENEIKKEDFNREVIEITSFEGFKNGFEEDFIFLITNPKYVEVYA